jgi:hypothetical protein
VQADGEREMTEMVGGELHFVPGRGEGELRQGHHAGIVDEDVQRPGPRAHEAGHRGRIGQVQLRDPQRTRARRQLFGDPVRDFPAGLDVAYRQCHLGAR